MSLVSTPSPTHRQTNPKLFPRQALWYFLPPTVFGIAETLPSCFLPSSALKLAAALLICVGHKTGKQPVSFCIISLRSIHFNNGFLTLSDGGLLGFSCSKETLCLCHTELLDTAVWSKKEEITQKKEKKHDCLPLSVLTLTSAWTVAAVKVWQHSSRSVECRAHSLPVGKSFYCPPPPFTLPSESREFHKTSVMQPNKQLSPFLQKTFVIFIHIN